MASALDICNLALIRIGEEPITGSTDPPNIPGSEPKALACNAVYETHRDILLETFPWRFAKRMIELDIEDQTIDITAITQANPVVVTASGHQFVDYKHVYITGVDGMTELNDNTYRITSTDQTAGTFALEGVDGTGYGAYTSGGTVRLRPPFKYEYEFVLPADFLRDWTLYPSAVSLADGTTVNLAANAPQARYEIMEGGLLTGDDEINLEYIGAVTDAEKFSPAYIHALYLFMAIPLAQRLGDSKTLVQQVTKDYRAAINNARLTNAIMGNPPESESNTDWQAAGRG